MVLQFTFNFSKNIDYTSNHSLGLCHITTGFTKY